MSALFPPWTNTLVRLVLLGAVVLVGGGLGLLVLYVRTPLFTGQANPIEQPVEFDHRHHVADDGIDCRYCHSTVERSPMAGFPATRVCMSCHAQVWNASPLLRPVREAYFDDRPIAWNRVHRLPDFVYFDHSVHVRQGVGCVTCHGRVDEMARVEQVASLTMGFCLDCHRAPERLLRPRSEITGMTWQPDGDPLAAGRALAAAYGVHTRTSCTTCHR
jgi:hypothetical protein